MSDHLVYLARTSRFGERNASRKLAMIALCNASSDDGHGIVMTAEEIAEAAEMQSAKNGMRVRAELVGLGLIEIDTDSDGRLPGQGRGAKGTYRINVARLRALHEFQWSYADEARAWRERKGGGAGVGVDRVLSQHPIDETPVEIASPSSGQVVHRSVDVHERVLPQHPKSNEKGAGKGDALGAGKGAVAPTSSIKESNSYWIDDVDDLALPDWAIEVVKEIEPDRWSVLAEAFLRWDGARKAVDIGKAFVGWTKSILGISKPGKGRISTRADWAKIYALAGVTAEQVREGVSLPTAERLAQRSNGDWRLRLRNEPVGASEARC